MALLTGEPRTATVRAITDASLLEIDREHFDELVDRSPTIRLAIEQLNAQRLTDNVRTFTGTEDARQWQEVAVAGIQRLSRNEEVRLMAENASTGAPLAIFLGVMLDGIPESIVIGSGFSSISTYQFTFLAAVFLSNMPEAYEHGGSEVGLSTIAGFLCAFLFSVV